MKSRIIFWLGLISLILCVLSSSISLVIWFRPIYWLSIDWFQLDQISGLSQSTLWHNYNLLMNYLTFPTIQTLNLPDFVMSEAGRFHFYEVKYLFLIAQSIFILSLPLAICFVRWVRHHQLFQRLLFGIRIFLGSILILGTLIALDFDRAFVTFHHLLFNNDAWIFDVRTDPIILVLPETFFMLEAFLVLLVLIISFSTIWLWAKYQLYLKQLSVNEK
ncbi:TIGR01906 family membrane protein [Atopobacter phocae]|uniref:TIGR01906 family membrane protein n=1 Tax=Atopobacter phocae TaxID=136492 RepID=UPI0004704CF8|nr:TIGR01906 family membrane protein [Atopobacter phocae]